jgi:hypothetical protein
LNVEQILVGAGAQCVGGDLILGHKVVGNYRDGMFSATLDGMVLVDDFQQKKQEEILAIARASHDDMEVHVEGLEPEVTKVRRGRRSKAEE